MSAREHSYDHCDPLREIANRYVAAGHFAGIAWHLERNGRQLSAWRCGAAGVLHGTPLHDNAIYRIYALTKPMISVLALTLIDDRQIRLGDAVAAYVPAFADARVLRADAALRLTCDTTLNRVDACLTRGVAQ